jgi:hypothetical protein
MSARVFNLVLPVSLHPQRERALRVIYFSSASGIPTIKGWRLGGLLGMTSVLYSMSIIQWIAH